MAIAIGLVYLVQGVLMWAVLPASAGRRAVAMWSVGMLLAGTAIVLSGQAMAGPTWLVVGLRRLIEWLGHLCMVLALRHHLQRPLHARAGLMAVLVVSLVYGALRPTVDWRWAVTFASLVEVAVLCLVAWHALAIGRRSGSVSARVLAAANLALAVPTLLRAFSQWFMASSHLDVAGFVGWDMVLLVGVNGIAAICTGIGYMGMVLDDSRAAEQRARRAQQAEAQARGQAELTAAELRELLAQRDLLAGERERMLAMLAHEIRQPLHNASGALQAATTQLRQATGDGQSAAQDGLGRAQAVLSRVHSVLDNTLAAASLLDRDQPLGTQEVDLDFLIDLVLGDLDDPQRARVQVQWISSLRSADLDPGLMRLALRNLLLNALVHAGPHARVRLLVDEVDNPPELRLCVADDGPGADLARLRARLDAHQPGQARVERGLGLFIVREVTLRHGGRLQLAAEQPHGLRACIVLPLPA